MGGVIAANASRAGFDVYGYDISAQARHHLDAAGAQVVADPRELARTVGIIALVVKDDEQVRDVILGNDGVLDHIQPGSVVVVHSTVHPATVKEIAAAIARAGSAVVDAPMTGGQAGAEAKTLCYMVGGDESDFQRCRALFETSAAKVFYVGELGAGSVMKLVQQAVFCLNRLAAYEGMALAKRSGIKLDLALQILHESAAQSHALDRWEPDYKIKEDDEVEGGGWTRDQFASQLLTLNPAVRLAQDLGMSLPVTALAQQLFPPRYKRKH